MRFFFRCLKIVFWMASAVTVALSMASVPQAGVQKPAQPQEKPQKSAARLDPKDLPVSLDRIQEALARTPMLRFDQAGKPVFRVQVFGDKPTIEDILGPDWERGPVPHGSMTHDEFLSFVTPKDFQGYAEYSNKEGMQLAATSFLFQWTLQRAIQKYRETKDDREREAARQEVIAALNALEEARAKAGMKK